jgi:hypothetical protein
MLNISGLVLTFIPLFYSVDGLELSLALTTLLSGRSIASKASNHSEDSNVEDLDDSE